MDILKACVYYKTKGLQESVAFADEVDLNLDTIGKLLGFRIIFIDDSLRISKSNGPELFMRYKNKRLIFHTNPAKISVLPAGLNKVKGAKYKIKDLIGFSNDNSAMTLTDVPRIEEKYGVNFEIWRKKNLKLHKPCVKKIKSGNIPVHCDTTTKILFLITDNKLYFRCNLNKCKK